jgi:N6-L-threonylcarbamoyladenine synthase
MLKSNSLVSELMICLGIESTAHTYGVGIVQSGRNGVEFLANERDTFKPPAGWGIEPVKAAKHHRELKDKLLNEALARAGIGPECVDLVAWSQGPGFAPCLLVGKEAAFDFAEKYNKPIVGINHCIAHIEIGRHFAGGCDPVTLYVSGANTQVLAFAAGRYRCFGETMDIGIGNALDKFGRESGMKFPAGPKVEQLAKTGKWIGMPYVVKGMDLSFSGITTEALKKLKAGQKMEDVCFSFQESAFAMLAEVSERAMAHTENHVQGKGCGLLPCAEGVRGRQRGHDCADRNNRAQRRPERLAEG